MIVRPSSTGFTALSALLVIAPAAPAQEACLKWSPRFAGGSGLLGSASELLAYDDGSGPKLYVAGQFGFAGGMPLQNVARYDGQAWSAVGATGVQGKVNALAIYNFDAGPRLVAAGASPLVAGSLLAQWNGTQWTPAPASPASSFISSLGLYQGQLFISSPITAAGINYIARWTGAQWAGAGAGLNSVVWDQQVFDDGTGPCCWWPDCRSPTGSPTPA